MAEEFLKKFGGNRFAVMSGGLEAGTLNPLAVEVMREEGIDISTNKVKSVFEYYKNRMIFDYVITVCDGAHAEKCPIFLGTNKRIHWGFEDPSTVKGTLEEKLVAVRDIRDEIKNSVKAFVKSSTSPHKNLYIFKQDLTDQAYSPVHSEKGNEISI